MTSTRSDHIDTKIGSAFDALDANQNGYLEWSDYQSLVHCYLETFQVSKDDRRARALQAFCEMYWVELLRHAGVDGDQLTKEQFVTANRLASIDTSRFNMVEGAGHVIFDFVDTNGDNEISKEEFERFLRDVWQIDAPDAMDTFTKLDTDGDGTISRQEFIRAMREHFHSHDPEAAGSLFFGRL
jgi:Ca2+-binding EF-hand superfamily protein